jgi:F-box interacting protein
MECLPREIILNILSRLSVTSLLQSKFVCKAWLNLVQDPLLVSMHFSRATRNDPCLILHSDSPIQNQLYSLELSDLIKDDQRVNKIRVPVFPEFNVVGSCKGLLCLCDSSEENLLYVYNPFSRDYIMLPKSEELPNQSTVYGFGFSQTTNKFKVIQAVNPLRPRAPHWRQIGLMSFQAEVQILTLGSPAWRTLGKLPYRQIYQEPSQVLVCGRIHWSVSSGSDCPIISFDFEDEQFREVPKPPDCTSWPNMDLVDFGGCLAAVSYSEFEIWIMKEYDVKESWIKEFNIGKHLPRSLDEEDGWFYLNIYKSRVVGLLKNSKVLLEYECRALVTYDPKDGTFEHLTFPGMPSWFKVIVHEGSLNWIDTLLNDT